MSEHPEINYAVAQRDLKYYIFDWDDNILHMPTRIHLERKTESGEWVAHSVSTSAFSVIRTDTERFRPVRGDWEKAFVDFRDIKVDDEHVFLRDTRLAIDRVVKGQEPAAPSFRRFREAMVEGRMFAIVTSRGHDPAFIRKGVEYFVTAVLSEAEHAVMLRNLRGYLANFEPGFDLSDDHAVLDYYLSLNRYYGVMSSYFQQLMGQSGPNATPNTESRKQFAVRSFVQYVAEIVRRCGLTRPISVGFSDDDINNVEAIEQYIRSELGRQFPSIKFVVYYTDDPEIESGRKVVVQGQLDLALA